MLTNEFESLVISHEYNKLKSMIGQYINIDVTSLVTTLFPPRNDNFLHLLIRHSSIEVIEELLTSLKKRCIALKIDFHGLLEDACKQKNIDNISPLQLSAQTNKIEVLLKLFRPYPSSILAALQTLLPKYNIFTFFSLIYKFNASLSKQLYVDFLRTNPLITQQLESLEVASFLAQLTKSNMNTQVEQLYLVIVENDVTKLHDFFNNRPDLLSCLESCRSKIFDGNIFHCAGQYATRETWTELLNIIVNHLIDNEKAIYRLLNEKNSNGLKPIDVMVQHDREVFYCDLHILTNIDTSKIPLPKNRFVDLVVQNSRDWIAQCDANIEGITEGNANLERWLPKLTSEPQSTYHPKMNLLHYAVMLGGRALARSICQSNPFIIHAPNAAGHSALALSMQLGHTDIILELLTNGRHPELLGLISLRQWHMENILDAILPTINQFNQTLMENIVFYKILKAFKYLQNKFPAEVNKICTNEFPVLLKKLFSGYRIVSDMEVEQIAKEILTVNGVTEGKIKRFLNEILGNYNYQSQITKQYIKVFKNICSWLYFEAKKNQSDKIKNDEKPQLLPSLLMSDDKVVSKNIISTLCNDFNVSCEAYFLRKEKDAHLPNVQFIFQYMAFCDPEQLEYFFYLINDEILSRFLSIIDPKFNVIFLAARFNPDLTITHMLIRKATEFKADIPLVAFNYFAGQGEIVAEFQQAIELNDSNKISELLSEHPLLLFVALGTYDDTPLQYALLKGCDFKTINFIFAMSVHLSPSLFKECNKLGNNILHYALMFNQKVLINNIKSALSIEDFTQLLMQHNYFQETPAHYFQSSDQARKVLLGTNFKQSLQILSQKDFQNVSVASNLLTFKDHELLIETMQRGSLNQFKEVVRSVPYCLFASYKENQNLLHLVAKTGDPELFTYLAEFYYSEFQDYIAQSDDSGRTPADYYLEANPSVSRGFFNHLRNQDHKGLYLLLIKEPFLLFFPNKQMTTLWGLTLAFGSADCIAACFQAIKDKLPLQYHALLNSTPNNVTLLEQIVLRNEPPALRCVLLAHDEPLTAFNSLLKSENVTVQKILKNPAWTKLKVIVDYFFSIERHLLELLQKNDPTAQYKIASFANLLKGLFQNPTPKGIKAYLEDDRVVRTTGMLSFLGRNDLYLQLRDQVFQLLDEDCPLLLGLFNHYWKTIQEKSKNNEILNSPKGKLHDQLRLLTFTVVEIKLASSLAS